MNVHILQRERQIENYSKIDRYLFCCAVGAKRHDRHVYIFYVCKIDVVLLVWVL